MAGPSTQGPPDRHFPRTAGLLLAGSLLVGVGLAAVLVSGHSLTGPAPAALHLQSAYQVEGSSDRWVEQAMNPVPSIDHAGMELKMLGMEVEGTHVLGHLATISNPRGHVSLALPPGGCGSREKVTVTMQQHHPRCTLAINAGYFNVTDSACIGNVVSHGVTIQTVPLSQGNVNFGIKDGKFMIGYFKPEEVAGFDHLVSGVVWLVRDGKNYVAQGWKEANITVQTSGDKYATNLASRTAVGYDKDGRLIILQIDGSIAVGEKKRGMNMAQLADLLIEHGAVNAINLDGGGSSAMALNGVLINYPSDMLPPSCHASGKYQCERPVSSVLCVHELEEEAAGAPTSGALSTGALVALAFALVAGGAVCALAGRGFLATAGNWGGAERLARQISSASEGSAKVRA